jgi:hypothetical protein
VTTIRLIDRTGQTWRTEALEITGDVPLDERGYPAAPEHRALLQSYRERGFFKSDANPLLYQTRINTDEVNQAAGDVRQLIARSLGNPKHGRTADWWSWKCPLHNEQHGTALSACESGWVCRGKCATGGDAIGWIMAYHNLDFEAACETIMGQAPPPEQRRVIVPRTDPSAAEPPAVEWQDAAERVLTYAAHVLWTPEGAAALRYLREERGFEDWIIRAAKFGYVPFRRHPGEWRELEGLLVPSGITIAWHSGKQLWAVNVRRGKGLEPKYLQFKGGHVRGALYGVDSIVPGLPLVFVEGEFDRWAAYQFIGDRANVVTTGGAKNELADRWLPYLKAAPRVYGLFDDDEAGEKAFAALREKRRDVRRLIVPSAKDINGYALASPADALRWIRAVVC